MNRFFFFLMFVFQLLNSPFVCASILLRGDADAAAGTTFSIPVKAHVTVPGRETFYVGARIPGAQTFSVARVSPFSIQFEPFAPQSVELNRATELGNPLFNKGISLLSVLSAEQGHSPVDRLVVVTTDPAQAANLYLAEKLSDSHPISVLSVEDIKDALGATTSGILSIAATSGFRSGAFAAVKPSAGGNFGAPGSGVAVIQLSEQQTEDKKTILLFEQIPAQPSNNAVRAAALDLSSSFIKIQSNLTSMTNVVDLHWSPALQRLFVAIQGQAGAGIDDGLRAIAVGRITQQGKLLFVPIAPASVFTTKASDEIVGAKGGLAEVSIQKVRTMQTTTGLDYLIVLGGNGAPAATTQELFALPIVNTTTVQGGIAHEATQGTLARVDVDPVPIFAFTGEFSFFKRRAFVEPATKRSQIFTNISVPARIGGGPLQEGAIDDLVVHKDAVFAVVGTPADATKVPGIFYSQCLFDEKGLIKSWTPWQRVGGTIDQVFGISYESAVGNIVFMTGNNGNEINTLQRALWSAGSEQGLGTLGSFLTQTFKVGGVQGLFDFPRITPGLTNMSMLVATGFKQLVLIESGRDVAGAFIPNGGNFVENVQDFSQGGFNVTPSAQLLTISGGVLNELGPLVAVEIGVANNNGWLFVAGDGGLSVLSTPTGQGWDAATGLQPSFVGLVKGMTFKKIGNYSFVRSLIADDQFLYVLTDTRLDRIDMSASDFGQDGSLHVTTLATTDNPSVMAGKGVLLDLVVSEKFALLSTSQGMYRVGNGNNIRTATSIAQVGWTTVTINEAAGSAIQLYALSTTGRAQDVARFAGGNIYVLNGFTGESRGQVNRFTVQPVTTDGVTDSTLQPIPDIRVEGILSYFKNFGGFANQYSTDGALQLYTRCRDLCNPPFLKSAQQGPARNDILIPLDIISASTLVRVLRNSASGSWIVAGDVMRFNE